MSTYFARQCSEQYQREAILKLLHNPVGMFHDSEYASEKIHQWLLAEEPSKPGAIPGFLNGISKIQWDGEASIKKTALFPDQKALSSGVHLYYGLNGKREAVLRFLSTVSRTEEPGTLLLYSDESMDWLIEDLRFLESWKTLLSSVVLQGNHIKIIHTVSRDLNEMLEAISKWMPLYMTGAVEPYYYPKKRDGLFKRTLFIAPNKAAVTSTSMDGMTDKALNLLIQDNRAIEALKEEFFEYLSLCRPLMHIFTNRQREAYTDTLLAFEQKTSDSIVSTNSLSLGTMPIDVAKNFIGRSRISDKIGFLKLFQKGKSVFEGSLKKNIFREIIQIPDISMLKNGKARAFFFSIPESEGLTYTLDEYRKHLQSVIYFLENFENYHVSLINRQTAPGYEIFVKEDLGVILLKTDSPQLAFAISESNMTAAFWDYLNILFHESNSSRREVLHQLKQTVKSME
jgi:hypothetical protein